MAQIVRIIAGDTYASGDIVITLTANGAAYDLTGAQAVSWKTRHVQSATIATSAAAVQGAATLGKVSPVYTATESGALAIGRHKVQIEVTTASGAKRTFPSPDQPDLWMDVSEGL